MSGHVKEGCFKLIEYPEWYKPKNKIGGQSIKGNKNTKMVTTEGTTEENNPLDSLKTTTKINELIIMLSSLQQEVTKLMSL
uniref:Uncharacterized protein n=1 Tax=Manihot esculenta TaxID=3983 RepID=A0A2C9VK79_MANES